jgi:phosphoribosyl 1,2-cyclic phosphate phosphodiesterase
VDEACEIAQQLKPRQTFLTHVCHDLEHEETNASLPESIELAYDGLRLTINLP